jgi:hypothetical protein
MNKNKSSDMIQSENALCITCWGSLWKDIETASKTAEGSGSLADRPNSSSLEGSAMMQTGADAGLGGTYG